MSITCCFGSDFSCADSDGSFAKNENLSAGNVHDDDVSMEITVTELLRVLCLAVQRFLTLVSCIAFSCFHLAVNHVQY